MSEVAESTVEVQPASDSVSSDLAAAWAEFESTDGDTPNDVDTNDVVESSEPAAEIDAGGEISVEDGVDGGDVAAAEAAILEAPDNWSQEHKDTFAALAELEDKGSAAQQFLLDRHKSMEGDYTKKMEEVAHLRQYQDIEQVLEPFKDVLTQTNQTPASLMSYYVGIDQALSQDPIGTITKLAAQYGIEPSQLAEAPAVDPNTVRLENELNSLRAEINQRDQSQQQTRQVELENEIATFAEAKTEAGELAHPYFEEVAQDMAALAQTLKAQGQNPTLSDLYDKACRMNTSVHDKIQAAQQEAAEKQRIEEARQKAAKAKKASRTVEGTPSGASPTPAKSLRDELEERFSSY